MSGWNLTGRLISKHFGALGDKVAEAIAGFDPETATEADRDRLQQTLLQTAQKLASANADYEKESQDVVELRKRIASNEKVAEQLVSMLANGSITEEAAAMFCDELESDKSRLSQELQEETDAKQYAVEIKQIVDSLSEQLSQFDAAAKRAKQALANAEAAQDLQQMRLNRQAELNGLNGLRKDSSALSALTRRAQAMSSEAAGMKIVADLQQKPIDQAKAIDAIRASVANGGRTESLAERLARLSGKTEQAA
jgi:hypothetical protein